MIALMGDTKLVIEEVWRGEYNGTQVILLYNQITTCYTMQVFKCGKKIAEVVDEYQDVGYMLAKLLHAIPIDPKFLQLN